MLILNHLIFFASAPLEVAYTPALSTRTERTEVGHELEYLLIRQRGGSGTLMSCASLLACFPLLDQKSMGHQLASDARCAAGSRNGEVVERK